MAACCGSMSVALIRRRCTHKDAGGLVQHVRIAYLLPAFLAPAFAQPFSYSHAQPWGSQDRKKQPRGFFNSAARQKPLYQHQHQQPRISRALQYEKVEHALQFGGDKAIVACKVFLASTDTTTTPGHRRLELITYIVGQQEASPEITDANLSYFRFQTRREEVTVKDALLVLSLLDGQDWCNLPVLDLLDGTEYSLDPVEEREALRIGFIAVCIIAHQSRANDGQYDHSSIASALQRLLSIVRQYSQPPTSSEIWTQLLRSIVYAQRSAAQVEAVWSAACAAGVDREICRTKFLRVLLKERFVEGAMAICGDLLHELPSGYHETTNDLRPVGGVKIKKHTNSNEVAASLFLFLRCLCLNNLSSTAQASKACEILVHAINATSRRTSPYWGAVILHCALTQGYEAALNFATVKLASGQISRPGALAHDLLQAWFQTAKVRGDFTTDHVLIGQVIERIEAITGVMAGHSLWTIALKIALTTSDPSPHSLSIEANGPTPGEVHEAILLYRYAISRGQRPMPSMIQPLLEALYRAFLPDLGVMFELYSDVRVADGDAVNMRTYIILLSACARQRESTRAKSLLDEMKQLSKNHMKPTARLSVSARSDIVLELVRSAANFEDAWALYASVRDLLQAGLVEQRRLEEESLWRMSENEDDEPQHAGARPSAGARFKSLVAASHGWASRAFGSPQVASSTSAQQALQIRDTIPFTDSTWYSLIDLFSSMRLPLWSSRADSNKGLERVGCPPRILLFLLRDYTRFSGPPSCKMYTTVLSALVRLCRTPVASNALSSPVRVQADYEAVGRTRQAVYEAVRQLHSTLRADRTLQPDLALINALMRAYSHCRVTNEVVELWAALREHAEHQINKKNSSPAVDGYTLGTVLDFCGFAGTAFERMGREAWDWAGRYAPEARTKGAHDSFAELLCRRGRREEVVNFVFETMKRPQGIGLNEVRTPANLLFPYADMKTIEMLSRFARSWDEREANVGNSVNGGGGWSEKVRRKVHQEMPELWKGEQSSGQSGRRRHRS